MSKADAEIEIETRLTRKVVDIKTKPILCFNGIKIGSYGNSIAVVGKAKTGKSSLVSDIICSFINNEKTPIGFEVFREDTDRILYLDFEQGPEEYNDYIKSILIRCNIDDFLVPDSFLCMNKQNGTPNDKMNIIRVFAEKYSPKIIILDGLADVVTDVNSNTEAVNIVAELLDIATETKCLFISIIHENQKGETKGARGHLGSQIERKGQAVIYLKKNRKGFLMEFNNVRGAELPNSISLYYNSEFNCLEQAKLIDDEELYNYVRDEWLRNKNISSRKMETWAKLNIGRTKSYSTYNKWFAQWKEEVNELEQLSE